LIAAAFGRKGIEEKVAPLERLQLVFPVSLGISKRKDAR
jgi:hypothetical protein